MVSVKKAFLTKIANQLRQGESVLQCLAFARRVIELFPASTALDNNQQDVNHNRRPYLLNFLSKFRLFIFVGNEIVISVYINLVILC